MRTTVPRHPLIFAAILAALLTGRTLGDETVRVGAYQNPPKIFVTPDGKTTGLFPEILDDIAKRNGWRIEYVPGTWQECLSRLKRGKIDLMPDVAISQERRKEFDFSDEPVLVNWGTIYSRKDLPIHSFLDMQGRSVAVMGGSIHTEGQQGIKSLMSQFGVSCRFVEVDDYRDVLMLLDGKQADVGVINRLFGTLHADNFEVAPTPIIFNPRMLTFATLKGSKKGARLLKQINDDLKLAKQTPDSVYHQVLAYYLGGGEREWQGRKQRYLGQLNLSPELRRWIREHPTIRFGVDPGFAPFERLGKDGRGEGMAIDFLNIIAQKTGLKFELVPRKDWSESLRGLQNGEIDLLPCIGDSEERRRFIAYSEPYLRFARVVVTPLDSPVQQFGDLTHLRVGVQADSSHHAFLKEHTTIQARPYKTFEECLLALSRGEIDAAVGNLAAATHIMRELALTNIKLACHVSQKTHNLSFGVRKDWPELVSILDQAVGSIRPQQRNAILAKWLPLPKAAATSLDLTQQEREWLLMHPRIRVCWDRSWAPIEFAGPNGEPQGISMEYLRALEDMLGVKFDTSLAKDWQSAYEELKNGRLDMSSCLAITPQRLEHLNFTETYLTCPVVFFARKDMPYIRNMSELQGLRVAVVRDYATDNWVTRDYPELSLVRTATITEAFDLLTRKKIDVFIGNVLPGNYYLSKHQYRDLKIAGETPYAYKLRMAVRKDWPVFAEILRKALATMPETDRTAFYRKWVWVKYEHGFNYSLLIKIVGVALLVILMFLYWNRRLHSEVRRRKRAQAALAGSEAALRTSYDDLKTLEKLKEDLTHMIVHDIRSPLMAVSGSLELMALQSPEKLAPDGKPTPLDLARAGAQAAIDLAQSLLDISRLEAGQMPLKIEPLDLQAAAKEAIEALDVQARLAQVRLVLAGSPTRGKADPKILHRVLINLIGNAIKASAEGQTIDVAAMQDDSGAAIEIRDCGRGISDDQLTTIFDKFASVENGNGKDQYRTSVGLGLAFCRLAVEAHGGRIDVQSEVGKGSTFRIVLPPHEPEQNGDKPPQ